MHLCFLNLFTLKQQQRKLRNPDLMSCSQSVFQLFYLFVCVYMRTFVSFFFPRVLILSPEIKSSSSSVFEIVRSTAIDTHEHKPHTRVAEPGSMICLF